MIDYINYSDKFWGWIASRLPRRLVYFCAIRMWIHGTWGKYADTEVSSLTLVEALRRWEDKR